MNHDFNKAILALLCCPLTQEPLRWHLKHGVPDQTECGRYFFDNGIFVLMPPDHQVIQGGEKKERELVAAEHGHQDARQIEAVVRQHHCVPVMRRRAQKFLSELRPSDWVVDIGCGTGYYWRDVRDDVHIILADFALNNLKAAQSLLRHRKNTFFVQADAAHLPLISQSVQAIWSVQVTQHFPDSVMSGFMLELARVLDENFRIEIYNLNPALILKWIYSLTGKNFHQRGKRKDVELNKYSEKELRQLWRQWSRENYSKIGFSEFFFHPDLRLRSQAPLLSSVEQWLSAFPWLTRFFARQIHIELTHRKICC